MKTFKVTLLLVLVTIIVLLISTSCINRAEETEEYTEIEYDRNFPTRVSLPMQGIEICYNDVYTLIQRDDMFQLITTDKEFSRRTVEIIMENVSMNIFEYTIIGDNDRFAVNYMDRKYFVTYCINSDFLIVVIK